MLKEYIKKILYKLVLAERSPTKLALSFSLGTFLAFSPFLGLQTWLAFPLCWISGLNVTVTLTTLYVISNPFTMIPIIISGYMFGSWLFNSVMNLDMIRYNPKWVDSFLGFLARYVIDLKKYLGTQLCFWCYVFGATILAVTISLILYPIMKRVFTHIVRKIHGTVNT